MYNIEVNKPNIETWEHSGDCNVGILALWTAKEKGSLMHHHPPPPPPEKLHPYFQTRLDLPM